MPTQPRITQPPDGTSTGYRTDNGQMWQAGEFEGKPAIVFCDFPGNLLHPPLYCLVAVFMNDADRDFMLQLHHVAVTIGVPGSTKKDSCDDK